MVCYTMQCRWLLKSAITKLYFPSKDHLFENNQETTEAKIKVIVNRANKYKIEV